jgi:hypothetical protein
MIIVHNGMTAASVELCFIRLAHHGRKGSGEKDLESDEIRDAHIPLELRDFLSLRESGCGGAGRRLLFRRGLFSGGGG